MLEHRLRHPVPAQPRRRLQPSTEHATAPGRAAAKYLATRRGPLLEPRLTSSGSSRRHPNSNARTPKSRLRHSRWRHYSRAKLQQSNANRGFRPSATSFARQQGLGDHHVIRSGNTPGHRPSLFHHPARPWKRCGPVPHHAPVVQRIADRGLPGCRDPTGCRSCCRPGDHRRRARRRLLRIPRHRNVCDGPGER